MPPRDPQRVQLDFPELVNDLIKDLNLTGRAVGLLDFSDQMVPIYVAGQREGALSFAAEEIVYESSEIHSAQVVGAAANAVIVDTGQLAAGTYDVKIAFSENDNVNNNTVLFQHRNAANTVTLAELIFCKSGGAADVTRLNGCNQFALRLSANERLRWVVGTTLYQAGSFVAANIMAHRRPTI